MSMMSNSGQETGGEKSVATDASLESQQRNRRIKPDTDTQLNNSAPNCRICGSNISIIYNNMKDIQFKSEKSIDLYECDNKKCRHVSAVPVPKNEELPAFYSDYSSHEQWKKPHFVMRAYRSSIESICFFGDLKNQRMQYVDSGILKSAPGRLLDFGCGPGNLLSVLKKNGWSEIYGVDFDADAVSAARKSGLDDIYVGGIADLPPHAGNFEYIVMANVIEHLSDPLTDLKAISARLSPQGQVILRTPNASSFLRKIFGRKWRGWESPRHLNIFTTNSLSLLANRAGLIVKHQKPSNALLQNMVIESIVNVRSAKKWKIAAAMFVCPILCFFASLAYRLSGRMTGEEITMVLANSEDFTQANRTSASTP